MPKVSVCSGLVNFAYGFFFHCLLRAVMSLESFVSYDIVLGNVR